MGVVRRGAGLSVVGVEGIVGDLETQFIVSA